MVKTESKNVTLELKTTLNKEMAKRYEVVKKHTGLKDDKNVLAFLISEEYGRIESANHRRIFVAKEIYAQLENSAEDHGQSIEEFVEALIERNTKEGAKHGYGN